MNVSAGIGVPDSYLLIDATGGNGGDGGSGAHGGCRGNGGDGGAGGFIRVITNDLYLMALTTRSYLGGLGGVRFQLTLIGRKVAN